MEERHKLLIVLTRPSSARRTSDVIKERRPLGLLSLLFEGCTYFAEQVLFNFGFWSRFSCHFELNSTYFFLTHWNAFAVVQPHPLITTVNVG